MNECNIIGDLLPLYAEELTSPDSGEWIEKHLSSCAYCRDIWRRYREDLPKMEVEEHMVENYKKGFRKDKLKMVLLTLTGWLLVGVIAIGIFFYCGWEKGDFAEGTRYTSPDGVRSVELANLDDAGFWGNEESLVRFRFEKGYMNRYKTDWQELVVHWAPDSQTMLLVIQNGAGETELRIVDHTGGLPDGGTQEIPGLYPAGEEQDLCYVLADLCAEQGVTASDFAFAEWSDDSRYLYFRYAGAEENGLLEYDTDTGRIEFRAVPITELPVVPTGTVEPTE